MKKILSALFLCACLLFGTVFAAAEKPEIIAKAAMLIERNSGEILFEQNADEKVYPASLTKIMTALLILENCRLTDRPRGRICRHRRKRQHRRPAAGRRAER